MLKRAHSISKYELLLGAFGGVICIIILTSKNGVHVCRAGDVI
jgi:hypothetical protein